MAYIYKTGRIELRDQIKRHARHIRGKVLDIGAGNYARYKDLFDFTEYVAMDIAPGTNVDVVGKIEKIPLPDSSFDSIVCTQVLGDVFDLKQAFSELERVLKPGGKVLITESLFDPLHDEQHDFWRFTEHSLRRLAEDARLTVDVLEKRGGYHSVMAQLQARYWLERLNIKKGPLARPFSLALKTCGTWARFLDKRNPEKTQKNFTHGYILIAHKHA